MLYSELGNFGEKKMASSFEVRWRIRPLRIASGRGRLYAAPWDPDHGDYGAPPVVDRRQAVGGLKRCFVGVKPCFLC